MTDKLATYALAQAKARKEMTDKIESAVKLLSDAANAMGHEEVIAATLAAAISNEHRTLQQGIIRAMASAMVQYSESSFDARNEASVTLCRKLRPIIEQQPLPFI